MPRVPPKMHRPAMVEPRPVRADQRVGLERGLVGLAEVGQARRAGLLAGLDQDGRVEAERAALLEHAGQRRDVDRVLALVVGRAAAIHLVAFDHDLPRRQARPATAPPGRGSRRHGRRSARSACWRPRPGARSGTARTRRADWAARCSRSPASAATRSSRPRRTAAARASSPAPGWWSGWRRGAGDRPGSRRRRNTSLRARWRRFGIRSWALSVPRQQAKEPIGGRHDAAGPGRLQQDGRSGLRQAGRRDRRRPRPPPRRRARVPDGERHAQPRPPTRSRSSAARSATTASAPSTPCRRTRRAPR